MATDPQMFIRIAATVEDLKTAMAQARQAVTEAGEGAKEAGLGFQSFSEQFTAMGERIVERLAIYELLRVSFDTLKESLNLGAEIEHMAVSVGISTDELQKLTYAGQQYGVTSDLMVRATETLSAKLANGDKNLASAFDKMGISAEEFRTLSPNEAMLSLADAVGKIGDPMEKAGDMAQIFGMRLSRELIPAMADLRSAESAMPSSALISEEDVKHAHEFEIGLANLKTEVEAGTLSFIMFLAQITHLTSATDGLVAIQKKHQAVMNEITNMENDAAQGAGIMSVSAQALTAHLQSLTQDALIPLSAAEQKYIADARDMGGSAEEIAAAMHAPLAVVQDYLKTLDEGDKAFATWAAAWNTVRAAALPLGDTLGTIKTETVAGAEAAIANGVAHKTVAEAYHLSDIQLQALVTDVKQHTEAAKNDLAATLQIAELSAKADEAAVTRSKARLVIDEASAKQRVALELAADQQRVANGTMSQTAFLVEKTFLERQALDRHLALLKAEEAADERSNGVKMEAELAKVDERNDAGKLSKEQYEREYAEIESRYATQRAGIQDAYAAHVEESQQKTLASAEAAQAEMVAQFYRIGDAATSAAKTFSDSFINAADLSNAALKKVGLTVDQVNKALAKAFMPDRAINFQSFDDLLSQRTGIGEQFDSFGAVVQSTRGAASLAPVLITGPNGQTHSSTAIEAAKLGYGYEEIVQAIFGRPLGPTPAGPKIPGFIGGVENFIGGYAMVGEGGPELAYLPPGSNVYPHGTAPSVGSSAAPQTITLVSNLVVDGRVLASIVNEHNTRSMKQSRQFPAA